MDALTSASPGCLTCLALLGASLPAAAVELTPLVGVRFGGSFGNDCYCYQPSLNLNSSASYGGELDVPFARGPYALELYFSHQNTTLDNGQYLSPPIHDMDVNVFHVGVAAALPTNDKNFSWLIIASGGATVFDANSYSQTYPSVGLGVGMRWMANDHIGLRGRRARHLQLHRQRQLGHRLQRRLQRVLLRVAAGAGRGLARPGRALLSQTRPGSWPARPV